MKTMTQWTSALVVAVMAGMPLAHAQKTDDDRMARDIEVGENVLGTLIKQQFDQQRMFFPLEISGTYQPGYGVTFRLPADYTTPIAFTINSGSGFQGGNNNVFFYNSNEDARDGDMITINGQMHSDGEVEVQTENIRGYEKPSKSLSLTEKNREKKRMDMDSVRDGYNQKVIEAVKNFMVDYGDMISQLGANERIIVTNQGDQPRMWVNQYFNAPQRTHLSIESSKADIIALRQGKITREQALSKIKVINTEASNKVEPDLELISSIFGRLYLPDLSKTYFTENNIYFERLKDFGVIYYMQVYSSNRIDYGHWDMPTLGLEGVDQATRDKKVKEIYPKFEQELKENILEYGRTLKSLKDDEVMVFNVTPTQCKGCGIPASLEITVKGSVLKEFNANKTDKNTALGKFVIKRGANQ